MTKKAVVPFKGTKEQEAKLYEVLNGLKGVRGAVMPALQKAQDIYGYLPIEVQQMIADFFGVPLAEVYGVATFYAQFSLTPSGKYKVGVCLGTACYVKGSGDVYNKFRELLKLSEGESLTEDGKFSLEATRCIGCCGLAPVLTVNGEVYGKVTVGQVADILAKYE
ncbi:MAG: NAD(P)H-dependent oxidoreductase subunit E [Clostridiales bacterium]|nr:NAD(P)H-dependent oxidoreductase subunit E [Clostridiales bacterium]